MSQSEDEQVARGAERELEMKKWLLRLGLLLVLALGAVLPASAQVDPAVLAAEEARVAIVEKCIASTVAVFSPGGQGGGSGVVISPDGYALSNFHVTSACGDAMQCGMADGKLYDAVIVGLDPTGDVALIKLLGRNDFPAAELADSDQVRVGDWCFTVGNPFLLATDYQPSVAYGVISGVHRYQYPAGTILEYADCLQADAAINPGNSGGPMFDAQGRLIGINGRGSFEKRGRVNVGVGYAISINQIKNFLGYLKSGRIVDHATLGAVVRSDADRRVVVDDILEHSDAYRRGLRYGDEIIEFAGRPITTVNAFKNALGIFPSGWRVPLSFRRQGQRYDVMVRLRGVHAEIELEEMIAAEPQDPHEKMPIPKGEKPKDEPGSDPEGEEKHDGGPGKDPVPVRTPKNAPMPEIVKQHFEKKSGYVNYYFNELEQKRLGGMLTSRGNYANLGKAWAVAGKTAVAEEFRLEFSDAGAAIRLPSGELRVAWTGGMSSHLEPPGSGGLLAALALWRRMLVEGPKNFGRVQYLGTMPLVDREGLFDVLEATYEDVECLFYVDPQGSIAALEMYPESDVDPCELYFADYREFSGHWLPGKIEVHFGDGYHNEFHCESYASADAPQPEEE
jgi:S1-C subfamily serine protease